MLLWLSSIDGAEEEPQEQEVDSPAPTPTPEPFQEEPKEEEPEEVEIVVLSDDDEEDTVQEDQPTPAMGWTTIGTKICQHMASRKDLLGGAGDPLGFNAGITDPTYCSQDVPVNLTLQLIRRESLSVI